MVLKMSRPEAETWAYRADVAEQAIRNRHAAKLWGLPGTNLAMASWPAPLRHKVFINWHYWWQAQYLDCLVDAAKRVPSKEKYRAIRQTTRGIRIRNLTLLTKNKYYDDRAWMALALGRADAVLGASVPKKTTARLISCLGDGRQESTGVLPWREQDLFFNVPSNGPAAIALARAGRIKEAEELIDWVYANLLSDSGLLYDGIRLSMAGAVVQKGMFTYNQGVMIGACLEVGLALRAHGQREQATKYFTRVQNLIHAVAKDLATTDSVIAGAGGGDGGLFNGILVRYLADAAVRLPGDNRMNRAAARIARRLVLASGEKCWYHRLEVDGLPLFPADWNDNAQFPQGGSVAQSVGGAVRGSAIKERDLSVQLSGWMLMEACARVADFVATKLENGESLDSTKPSCPE
ncbi:glycoside hydrolase family 76 protein [Corynebacterium sp. LK11]|uniref:glycoside hydrolase family 76 protein n=1 Tax=Corynebacterium sp. LK11 TaxID=2022657 RepID=UPI0011CA96D2|nr:glycoside hydrolase family 76 protein [Corynebacterium sp. LK11]TXS73860.1 glycoside hydrolase family 76 [Corynebacterium sp. LK11]